MSGCHPECGIDGFLCMRVGCPGLDRVHARLLALEESLRNTQEGAAAFAKSDMEKEARIENLERVIASVECDIRTLASHYRRYALEQLQNSITRADEREAKLALDFATDLGCLQKKLNAALSPPQQLPLHTWSPTGPGCHASTDGECSWENCPQLRDGEPAATGRSCPRWVHNEEDEI